MQYACDVGDVLLFAPFGTYEDNVDRVDEVETEYLIPPIPQPPSNIISYAPQEDGTCLVTAVNEGGAFLMARQGSDVRLAFIMVGPARAVEYKPPPPSRTGFALKLMQVSSTEVS